MNKRFIVQAGLLAGVALAVTLLVYPRLPARVPLHWNAAGDIDGYGPRAAVFGLPALQLLLALLWNALPAISPRRYRIDEFAATWWFGGAVLLGLLTALQGVILWAALRAPALPDTGRAVFGVAAIALLLLGNVMGKVRRNFWFGVRTPWTLADERVWYATHRLAAKLMVASALLALGVLAAGLPTVLATVLLVGGALAPAPYSLLVHWRLARGGPGA